MIALKRFAALALILFVFACKKDESEEIIDVLTSKTWKFGLKDLNTATNPSGTSSYYAVPECEQDDTFLFKSDGSLVITYGTKKCDGNTTTTKTVNYTFNKQAREITIDGQKFSVTEENKTQFKYIKVVPGTSGTSNVIYLLQ
ncbi:hypothetical protein [Pedobacter sp.]